MLQIKTSRRVQAEPAALADQIDLQLTAVLSAAARSDFSRPGSHAALKPAPRARATGFAAPISVAGRPPDEAQFARF